MYNVPSKARKYNTISLSLARKYLPGKQCDNHRIICPMIENIGVIGKM